MRLVVFCNKARELTRMRTGVDDKSTEAGAKQRALKFMQMLYS